MPARELHSLHSVVGQEARQLEVLVGLELGGAPSRALQPQQLVQDTGPQSRPSLRMALTAVHPVCRPPTLTWPYKAQDLYLLKLLGKIHSDVAHPGKAGIFISVTWAAAKEPHDYLVISSRRPGRVTALVLLFVPWH